MPKVSVIIPVYNCERYIVESLDSVFSQDYPDLEVIVINDGSTDGSLEILEQYERPIFIINQENSGSAVARNAGMAKARGEYIAFLDSDDKWLPGKLKRQVEFLESNLDYGLVYSNWVCWTSNSNGEFIDQDFKNQKDSIIISRPLSGWLYCDLLQNSIVWTSSVLIRYSLYEKIGTFDTALRRGQDYDYWIRVSRKTKIHKLDGIHAVYRTNSESVTNRPNEINYEYIVLKNSINKWGYTSPNGEKTNKAIINRKLSHINFIFSYYHYHNNAPTIALPAIVTSIRYTPFKLKSWMYLLLIATKYLYNFILLKK